MWYGVYLLYTDQRYGCAYVMDYEYVLWLEIMYRDIVALCDVLWLENRYRDIVALCDVLWLEIRYRDIVALMWCIMNMYYD